MNTFYNTFRLFVGKSVFCKRKIPRGAGPAEKILDSNETGGCPCLQISNRPSPGLRQQRTLRQWCRELAPEGCKKRKGPLHSLEEQKKASVEPPRTKKCGAGKMANAQRERGSSPAGSLRSNSLLAKEAQGIDYNVDFRRKTSSRASKRLFFLPPFAPAACWWARIAETSIMSDSSSVSFCAS